MHDGEADVFQTLALVLSLFLDIVLPDSDFSYNKDRAGVTDHDSKKLVVKTEYSAFSFETGLKQPSIIRKHHVESNH